MAASTKTLPMPMRPPSRFHVAKKPFDAERNVEHVLETEVIALVQRVRQEKFDKRYFSSVLSNSCFEIANYSSILLVI